MMLPEQLSDLVARGALFVVNHSAGKDSQAMFIYLRDRVPAEQLVVVHADLPEVEWDGCLAHIRETIGDTPLHICRARRTLLQMIRERGKFPSPQQRQCTSDLKRGPIERTIRALVEARIKGWLAINHGWAADQKNIRTEGRDLAIKAGMGLVVNCMGMRAEESPNRSKLTPFKFSDRNSKAGREWYDWLPIHDWSTEKVFATIAAAGERPHWVYAAGMTRKSCCFCIMASKQDLRTAAMLKPKLYAEYVQLERETGQVMLMPSKTHGRLSLEQVTGITVEQALAGCSSAHSPASTSVAPLHFIPPAAMPLHNPAYA